MVLFPFARRGVFAFRGFPCWALRGEAAVRVYGVIPMLMHVEHEKGEAKQEDEPGGNVEQSAEKITEKIKHIERGGLTGGTVEKRNQDGGLANKANAGD